MGIAKRIVLFLIVNFLVVITLSFVLNLLHVRPYLDSHGINYNALLIFCLVWGMGGAFISLSLSRIMAKSLMGVKIVSPDTTDPELRSLYKMIEELARNANLPVTPEVGVYSSPEMNAFATGPSKKRSLVAVSSGLLQKMSSKELEGVLAHEISHIANGDMVTMTLLQGIVNAFVMFLARILAYVLSTVLRARSENSSSSPSYFSYMIMVFVFEIIFMILGSIVVAAFSRRREFKADAGGADLAGKEKMILALEALQRSIQIRDKKTDRPSFEAMKISTPKKMGFATIFATHPPLEKRIEKLKRLVF